MRAFIRRHGPEEIQLLVFRRCQSPNCSAQFKYLQTRGTFGPVVPPADDNVATIRGMTVVSEVSALEFEFNSNPLPLPRSDLSFGFPIPKPRLNRLDQISQFSRHHSK